MVRPRPSIHSSEMAPSASVVVSFRRWLWTTPGCETIE